jgi:hypothetical protein
MLYSQLIISINYHLKLFQLLISNMLSFLHSKAKIIKTQTLQVQLNLTLQFRENYRFLFHKHTFFLSNTLQNVIA